MPECQVCFVKRSVSLFDTINPQSLAHFASELLAHFSPEYSPYRPFVDELVLGHPYFSEREEVDVEAKKILLSIPTLDVVLDGKASPLMNAVQRTTASLARCYQSEEKIILYPSLQHDA